MTRFIKIFTILTGLTLITACGNTQGLIDALTAAVSDTDRNAPLCVQNPFNQRCDPKEGEVADATVQSARTAIERSCTAKLDTSDNCINFVAFVCQRDNPYHPVCTQGENDYSSFQANITEDCITNGGGPLCDRAIAAVCGRDAFQPLCLTDLANRYNQGALVPGGEDVIGFSAKRAEVCDPDTGLSPDSPQCTSAVRAACSRDPLDAVCANRDEYFVARDNACWIQGRDGGIRTTQCADIFRINNLPENAIPACRANYVGPTGANRFNPRCYNVVIGVCNLNPFDALCDENTNYLARHRGIIDACTAQEPDATFCVQAKTSVCADNPFDPLCLISYTANTNDYTTERQTAVNDCRTNFVAGKRCEGAAVEFCADKTATDLTDLFSSLCLEHPGTDAVRQPLCVGDRAPNTPISARCTETATRICDGDPLNALCEDVAAYRAAQFSACVQDSDHASCAAGTDAQFSYITPVIACLQSPFSADCLNVNTEAGEAFVPHAKAAQDSYCESGGARTTSTLVETTADRVNCTNIGSLPVFASLAIDITQNGVRTYNSDGSIVTANEVTPQNPNIGGFLRTGVFGTRLGNHIGLNSGDFYDETNNGNFDRGDPTGGPWTGLPGNYGAGGDGRIFENNASKVDPKDGFTYFLAEEDPNFLSYAGIWQTTNFGAPLALQPAGDNGNITAIWKGTFTPATSGGVLQTIIADGEPLAVPLYSADPVQTRVRINDRTTDFYVDFTDGKFNFHNTVANDGTGIVFGYTFSGGTGSQRKVPNRLSYSLDGYFGTTDPNDASRTLNPGELGGNVTLVIQPLNQTSGANLGAAGAPTIMPLTGLIGVEGAVGIFLDPNPSSSPNVGGFTAAPMPTN